MEPALFIVDTESQHYFWGCYQSPIVEEADAVMMRVQEEYRAPAACIGLSPDGTFDKEANKQSIEGAMRRNAPGSKPAATSAPKPPKLPAPKKDTTARAQKKFDELDVDSSGYEG